MWLGIIPINFSCSNVNCTESQTWSWSFSCFPSIASGCFCPFFFSPSYQLSHEKHFSWTLATDLKELHIVSPHCAITEHQPHLGTAEQCAVSPDPNTTSLMICLWADQPHRSRMAPAQAAFLTKLFSWCSLLDVFCCLLLLCAGQNRRVITGKQGLQSWNSENPSLSTAVFVLQMNSPKLD